jgi:hypothetical protein
MLFCHASSYGLNNGTMYICTNPRCTDLGSNTGVRGYNSVTNRLSYGVAPNTHTSERFSQTASRRKMENAKLSSSWRGNSGKIIDFTSVFRKLGTGKCKITRFVKKW